MKVLLTSTDRQTNDDPICNAAHSSSDGIVNHDLLPSIPSITTVAEMFVESIADLVQNLGHTNIDLPGQVSSYHREIVNESIIRSGSEPFETQDFVLHFGRSDEVFGLLSKPFGVVRGQDDGRPVERRSDERFTFAAVLSNSLSMLLKIQSVTALPANIPSPNLLLGSYARTLRRADWTSASTTGCLIPDRPKGYLWVHMKCVVIEAE